MQVAAFAGARSTSATSRRGIPMAWRCGRTTSSASSPAGSSELGVPVHRGRDVTGFAAGRRRRRRPPCRRRHAACAGTSSAATAAAAWSAKLAGIDFPGWDPSVSSTIAEVEMQGEPAFGFRSDATGSTPCARWKAGAWGVVVRDAEARPRATSRRSTICARRSSLSAGSDFGLHLPTWISRFTDATRQAATYRDRARAARRRRRAHPLPGRRAGTQPRRAGRREPWLEARAGGHGSRRPTSLLDTYHAERHPVAARVLKYTMAHTALQQRRRPHRRTDRHRRPTCSTSTKPASASPGSPLAWTSTTTSARDTRCSGAACPISTWSPPTARCGSSPCCTTPARCCSTSASPAASTSRPGRIGSS